MASELDLVNDALLMLGEPMILALDQDMDVAIAANGLYPGARDFVLYQHPWNGCVKQVALIRVAAAPLMKYDFAFLCPSDVIRLLEPEEQWTEWQRGTDLLGQQLVWSNHDTLIMEYIFRNPVVEMYSPGLRETLSAYLAYKLTYPLTDHGAKRQAMQEHYLFVLNQAKLLDQQEQSPITLEATALTDDVRRGG